MRNDAELLHEVVAENTRLRIYREEYPEDPREWDSIGHMVCYHMRYRLGDEQAQNVGEYSSWAEWLEAEVLEANGGHDKVVAMPLYLYDHSGLTMSTGKFSCNWDSGQVGWIWATKEQFRKETGYTEAELFSDDPHRVPQAGEHVKVAGFGEQWGMVMMTSPDLIVVDFDAWKAHQHRKPENVVQGDYTIIKEVMANHAEEILKGEVQTYDDYLTGNVYRYVIEEKKTCLCCGHVEYEELDSCGGFYGNDAFDDMKGNASREYERLFERLTRKT